MAVFRMKSLEFPAASICFLACLPVTGNAQQQEMRIERNMEFRHKMTLEAEGAKPLCSARVEIEYSQNNTIASASGTIDTEDCAAAFGEYTVSVRYRDTDGEVKTLDVEETWRRDDDQPVHFTGEYPIGDNVDLIRVRARNIRCECSTEANEPGEPPSEEQGDSE
jgi:hypothetical protein